MARHSFQPRNSLFPCFSLYFPTLRALLREISPIIFSALLFFTQRECFSDSRFPHSSRPAHLPISFDFLSALHSPLPLRSLPHFLSHSSPLFHLSPQLTMQMRAPSRITRVRVRSRTRPPIRSFLFIAFTASPTLRNSLCTNALGVKKNEKKPSQNTQQSQNQNLTTNVRFHPP